MKFEMAAASGISLRLRVVSNSLGFENLTG